jgi:hypothetical protein
MDIESARSRCKEIQGLIREPDSPEIDKIALVEEYVQITHNLWKLTLPKNAYSKEPKRIAGFR